MQFEAREFADFITKNNNGKKAIMKCRPKVDSNYVIKLTLTVSYPSFLGRVNIKLTNLSSPTIKPRGLKHPILHVLISPYCYLSMDLSRNLI